MKLGNIDFCKIKKITLIEVIVLAVVFMAIGIYYSPHFMYKKEERLAAKIKSDNAIFTARVIEEFAKNENVKASDVAKKIAGNLNQVAKNPYNKKMPAYTFEKECVGCNSVTYDDNAQMITLTTLNNKNELILRTVIKPPSFVVYSKFDEEKK